MEQRVRVLRLLSLGPFVLAGAALLGLIIPFVALAARLIPLAEGVEEQSVASFYAEVCADYGRFLWNGMLP